MNHLIYSKLKNISIGFFFGLYEPEQIDFIYASNGDGCFKFGFDDIFLEEYDISHEFNFILEVKSNGDGRTITDFFSYLEEQY